MSGRGGPRSPGTRIRPSSSRAVHGGARAVVRRADGARDQLAETLIRRLPSLELVRLVSSGTEATMTALRLARGYTGRPKIIKFEGCYHGHGDSLLVKAGSGALTFGQPSSAGVPSAIAGETIVLPYNDLTAVAGNVRGRSRRDRRHHRRADRRQHESRAAQGGVPRRAADAVRSLRRRADLRRSDDRFPRSRSGAQGLYGVTPDLTTLGKVIGGGMPVGAFGGKRAIMECIAPLGPVYQAGTLSGNPVAVAAGIATLATHGSAGLLQRD